MIEGKVDINVEVFLCCVFDLVWVLFFVLKWEVFDVRERTLRMIK